MIRIRRQDGTVLPLPADATFVEIVNDMDQTVGCVLYSPQPGTVYEIWPGSVDAERYAGLFQRRGVQFATRLVHRAES